MDKGNVKEADKIKFDLTKKAHLKQIMCPTTQEYSAMGGIENEKLYTCPNVINNKPVMKARKQRISSNKFAKTRGLFKSEVVKKPLSILNKLDSARILKEIAKVEEQ